MPTMLHRLPFLAFLVIACATLAWASPGSGAGGYGMASEDSSSRLSTIPHNAGLESQVVASALHRVVVLKDGIREPLNNAARVALDELTGRTSLAGQAPEYTYLSMMYTPERWFDARILPVEHPEIGALLGANDKWISPRFVVDNPNLKRLEDEAAKWFARKSELELLSKKLAAAEQVLRLPSRELALSGVVTPELTREAILAVVDDAKARDEAIRDRAHRAGEWEKHKPFAEATARLFNRVHLLTGLKETFAIAPDKESIRGDWLTPEQASKSTRRDPLFDAAAVLDGALLQAFRSGDGTGLDGAANAYLATAYQNKLYPPASRTAVKDIYVRSNPWQLSAWTYLLTALVLGLFFFFRKPGMKTAALAMMCAGFVIHTGAVGTRIYLTGHMPVSNMYEAITFASWAAMLLAVVFEAVRRSGHIGLAACAMGYLLLMGSSFMPLHDTRLHPLRAVLNSYWLNIHVTTMLLSYGAFAIAAFFAAAYVVKAALGREALFGGTPAMTLQQTEEFAYRLVQVGWPLLTLGITLGAVWADVAWGRYWGWDPKETWAFITWIVYTVYLHTRMVMGWRGMPSAVACVLGFLCVLITWLGVSYHPWFSGGLHSYASPT